MYLPALTVRQPWANLIATGAKRIETRSWRTRVRGDLVIHSSKRHAVAGLPASAIVAVARVVDCVHVEDVWHALSARERAAGDYRAGRYAWLLDDVRALDVPVVAAGQLGLWRVDGALLKKVYRALG